MAHYEQALRQVRYRNWRPATLSERRFRLTCSELNGRYTSNEFNLEVGVMFHPAPFLTLSLLLSTCIVYLVPAFSSCAFILCYPSHFSFFFLCHSHHVVFLSSTYFFLSNGVCPASVGQRSSPLGTSGTRQSYGGPASVHETRPSPTHDTHSQLAHVR